MASITKFAWITVDKSNWMVEGYDGAPPRVRMLDDKTFAAYRDGRYLGSEASLDAAKARCVKNERTPKNSVTAAEWAKAHPDEIPPGLQLTAGERAKGWQDRPPRPAARVTGGRASSDPRLLAGAHVPPSVGVQQVPTSTPLPSIPAPRTRGGNKIEIIAALLRSKQGCTREEVLRATGWTAVSMQAQAKTIGVGLRIDKSRKPFRYYAEDS